MTFEINRVYTRSGDRGETGLVGGRRVSKSSPRVIAYGDIDELNSWLGLIKARTGKNHKQLNQILETIQQELFDLGSELATDPADAYPGMYKTSPEDVKRLEQLCDRFSEGLPELPSFILPGGSELAALCHIARTVCRRAERGIVALMELAGSGKTEYSVSDFALQYVNRLSDLLFIVSRWVLKADGLESPLWVQAAKRMPLKE